MTIALINPKALPKVDLHRQVSIATGSKLVFMPGQVAWTPTEPWSATATSPRRSSSPIPTSPPPSPEPAAPSTTSQN